jgi:hypothetical protein
VCLSLSLCIRIDTLIEFSGHCQLTD